MEHKIDVLGCGVIYIDGERVLGGKPYGLFSTVNWSATDEDLKRIADRCLEVISDRKTEPQTEYPTEWCEKCELWREDNCMGVAQCKRNIQILTEAYKQTEPQTERSE